MLCGFCREGLTICRLAVMVRAIEVVHNGYVVLQKRVQRLVLLVKLVKLVDLAASQISIATETFAS